MDANKRFESLVVLEFRTDKINDETMLWLIEKISSTRSKGGLNLQVRKVPVDLISEKNVSIIHVNGNTDTLLNGAEKMQLKKKLKDGSMKILNVEQLDKFENFEDKDNLLSMAEKQKVILHELQTLRVSDLNEINSIGIQNIKFYLGQSIVPVLINKRLIKQVFPLHDRNELKILGADWYKNFIHKQPLDKIRNYFGETVALYFAFLGFYTYALIPPAFLGVFALWFPTDWIYSIIFFSIFNLISCTCFLELWKRYSCKLTYDWGTYGTERYEEARPEYYGALDYNQITGRKEPKYPKWKRLLRFYLVSVPVVFLCLVLAFYVMLLYFWMQHKADAFYNRTKNIVGLAVVNLPSIIYAVLIAIMNAIYRNLAKMLNDWENHRLQSAYNNHLILKLVLFDSVNCFMSLFYVAFYLQNMPLLRSHLAALLIVQQIIGQVQEALLPYLIYKRRKIVVRRKYKDKTNIMDVDENFIDSILQSEIEKDKSLYIDTEGTLNDYLELYLQFGYVFLFSAVFPSAAIWALLNNITEIRSDAFKLCRIMQRPFSIPAASLGAWLIAFEILSIVAVITNTAIIGLSVPVHDKLISVYGNVTVVLGFVFLEHFILALKAFIAFCIPDIPSDVATAMAKLDYEKRLSWENQVNSGNFKK